MCVSPKSDISTATEESWKFAKNAINSGFPKAAQDLMAVTAKVAGDKTVQGQTRAYWKRQANAVLADIKGQLAIDVNRSRQILLQASKALTQEHVHLKTLLMKLCWIVLHVSRKRISLVLPLMPMIFVRHSMI